MEGSKSVTVATNTQEYITIQLPNALQGITPAAELTTNKQSWNSNEEIASLLISFDKHKEWQQWELKIRPVSGSMLLYNRNKVRHRRDGYCWKKRKAGKTIREDHMKLKVQGIECIYGSYVHSAILPTFHRRSYWLLQNPDIVLVHYLNVPIPDNTKLTIPTLPPYMDKKEWTKEDLVDQLRPMFSTGQPERSRDGEQLIEDMIAAIVQQLLGQQESQCKNKPQRCDASCDKNCPHSRNRRISPKDEGISPAGSVPGRLVSLLQPTTQRVQSTVTATQVVPSTHAMLVTSTASQPVSTVTSITDHMTPSSTPLILNLSDFQGSNGFIIVSGQTTTSIPIINSSSTPQPSVTSHRAQHVQLINPPVMSVNTVRPNVMKDSLDSSASVPMQISSSSDDFQQATDACVCVASGSGEDKPSHPVSMFDTTSGFTLPQGIMSAGTFHTDMHLGDKFPTLNQSDLSMSRGAQGDNSGPDSHCDGFKPADSPFPPHSDLSLDGLDLLDFSEISKLYPTFADACVSSPNVIPHSSLSMPDHDKGAIPLINCATCLQNQSAQQHPHPPEQLHSCSQQHLQSCDQDQLQSQNVHSQQQQNLLNQRLHSQQHMSSLQHHQPPQPQHSCEHQQQHSQQHRLQTQQQVHPCSQHQTSDQDISCRDTLPDGKDKMLSFSTLHSMLPIKVERDRSPSKTTSSGSLAMISDFSPDWSYTEGGIKVLVTGPWCSSTSTYFCVFDRKSVSATLVQPGVLRCFAPGHDAGLVTLEVAMESCVISNSVVFEYKAVEARETRQGQLDWYSVDDNQLQLMLLDRLEQIEKRLVPVTGSEVRSASTSQSPEKSTDCESQISRYCDFLSGRPWPSPVQCLEVGQLGVTLLHLAAGLGYHKLVNRLLKWRSQNPSSVIEHEVDVNCTDNYSSTPLMWACARGHVTTALLLYNWNSGPLKVCNKDGLLPLDIARENGHHVLADHLDLMEQDSDMQTDTAVMDGALDSLNPFLSPVKVVTSDASPLTSLTSTPVIQSTKNQSPLEFHSPPPQDANGSHMNTLHIEIPPPQPLPFPKAESKLVRRFSEQNTASCLRRRFNKRFSMEIFPDSSMMSSDYCSNVPDVALPSLRIANSEPDLGANIEALTGGDNPMISEHLRDMNSPDLFLQAESLLGMHRLIDPEDSVFGAVTSALPVQAPIMGSSGNLAIAMDTDENLSVRSESPFIDVEKVSSDEEDDLLTDRQSGSIGDGNTADSQHQMVTLANQIIAAMPERIKSSPSRCDEGVVTECHRDRSESHSSITSQGSPHASSYGDDSGISTPLGEGLSFDEYRYREIGTPASSLSPDSTCLPSPYSPYSFQLDSPPPTTADFNEYFNAPTTFMEKDFSQLTLSDHEQRKLYEAAKVIQNAFRIYRDKQQQQQQLQKEIEAAILIQSYYRRYKQYIFYKKMTQAAVLIQSQFRSYSAQKRYKKSRDAAVVIQNQYRTYKEHERFKKSRNAAVIIQQRFRSHYQRRQNQEVASNLLQMASESNDNSPVRDAGTTPKDEAVDTELEMKKSTERAKKKSRSRSSSCGKSKPAVADTDVKRPGTKTDGNNSESKGNNCDISETAVSHRSSICSPLLTDSSS